MSRYLKDSQTVFISLRFYNLLLHAYPAEFRREYAAHMAQVFRDCCLAAERRDGLLGMLLLWIHTLVDFLISVIQEYSQKETYMTKDKFIRLSGWALMFGGFLLLFGFFIGSFEEYYFDPLGGFDGLYEYGQLLGIGFGTLLIVIGMAGLYAGYGEKVGKFGQGSLIVGVLAGAVSLISILPMSLPTGDIAWVIWSTSLVVMFLGLALFGVAAVRTKALPRGNILPILAGAWLPLVFILGYVFEALTGRGIEIVDAYLFALMGVIAIALFLLGYIVQSDKERQELPI